MRAILLILLIPLATLAADDLPQGRARIWRCPDNSYTNDAAVARERICIAVSTKKKLTPKERKDYQDCRLEAAKAPTPVGVEIGLTVCDERFGQ